MYKMESIQNYNTQLDKCIENMREKRDAVNKKIITNEEEKKILLKDIKKFQNNCPILKKTLLNAMLPEQNTINLYKK